MMELGDCHFCGSACPWRGNARPTRLSPSVAAGGPPVGPWGRSGPSWPMSVSVTTRGNHPGHPTAALPLPLRPPPLPLWLLTAWPGGAAWCRAALGRGLVVVWLYERPGLAFPYPLRVHPVRCLPAAWLHSSVATFGAYQDLGQRLLVDRMHGRIAISHRALSTKTARNASAVRHRRRAFGRWVCPVLCA